MRTIERTTQFKKDFKREAKGPHRDDLKPSGLFTQIVTALANNVPLDARYRDHALGGDWKDHRDCHLKPDWVLIYSKPDDKRLQLVRLGSHSELSL